MSGVAHFFVVVGGSKIHERLAHFFVDIYMPRLEMEELSPHNQCDNCSQMKVLGHR